MKIILSRKGFDSANGGCASPILPDGTLLSMPIPDATSTLSFVDVSFKNKTYAEIWDDLKSSKTNKIPFCHLDPDIRREIGLQKNTRMESGIWANGGGTKTFSKPKSSSGRYFFVLWMV